MDIGGEKLEETKDFLTQFSNQFEILTTESATEDKFSQRKDAVDDDEGHGEGWSCFRKVQDDISSASERRNEHQIPSGR